MVTALGAVVVAVVGGYFGWRNSGRATMSSEQREWLREAMREARMARTESAAAEESAAKATKASHEAKARADAAERRLRDLDASAQDLIDWIARVMQSKDQIEVQKIHDPAVARLLAVINGGPASLSGSKLRTTDG